MFGIHWNDLSRTFRGTVLIIGGTILLLHTLGILERWLNIILITTALAMIIYGVILAGLWEKAVNQIKKN